jgi:hypothetical protein
LFCTKIGGAGKINFLLNTRIEEKGAASGLENRSKTPYTLKITRTTEHPPIFNFIYLSLSNKNKHLATPPPIFPRSIRSI